MRIAAATLDSTAVSAEPASTGRAARSSRIQPT
jgi:hypothetical protein